MEEPTWDEDAALADYMDVADFDDYDEYEMMGEEEQAFREFEKNGSGGDGAAQTTTAEGDDDVLDLLGIYENAAAATPTAASTTNTTAENAAVTPDGNVLNAAEDDDDDDDDPLQSVEEYLAARKQENQLFSFQRYKKGSEWRAPLNNTSNNSQQQQQQNKRNKNFALSLQRQKATATATAAPDAQFLDLLQWRSTTSSRSKTTTARQPWRTPRQGHETIPMTLADGTRVYLICTGDTNSSTNKNTANKPSCSLGVTIKELIRRVDNIKRRQIHVANQLQRMTTGGAGSSENNNNNRSSSGFTNDSTLWVDKHAPHSFPQLLSDERTNREVLRALRAWDPYVFHKQAMPERKNMYKNPNGNNNNDSSNPNAVKPNGSFKKEQDGMETKNANDKRPAENARVIMLSGPPGVGKTTLAHIVARHAGYRPLEVNASDDRSASVLTERITRAMESVPLNFKGNGDSNTKHDDHGKPNCLILDEIDGADARGAIQALADIIKAEIPAKNAKQKGTYLRRPIICICNHKYAPALRPLLPYAVHFNVEPPSSARLVARLKTILNKEKLNMMAGGSLLHQLVVSTGGDIRSCLFTLQFAAAEGSSGQDLSQALMNSLNGTGLKDDRNDVASTITSVFRKVKSTNYNSSPSKSSLNRSRGDRASIARVMNAVEGFGDDSTAINALFMNILKVSYIDPAFDRCSAAHELLSGADLRNGSGYTMQRLNTPPIAAGIHLLCRVEVKPRLTFTTRELSDSQYQQEANQSLVQKFSEGLPVKSSNFKCRDLLAKEFVPMVLWVLSAGEGVSSLSRPASSIDLLSKAERQFADYHVAILRSLGLTYIQDAEREAMNAGKSHYRSDAIAMKLDPPIHRLVQYRGSWSQIRRKQIPANMKVLLAHQVRMENLRSKMHIMEVEEEETEPAPSKETDRMMTSPAGKKNRSASPVKATPRKLDQLAASATLPEAKRSKPSPAATSINFLGVAAKKGKAAKSARRAAALGLGGPSSSSKVKLAHTGSGFQLNQVVRMKYVKGFTQAVRTPCRLQDLE